MNRRKKNNNIKKAIVVCILILLIVCIFLGVKGICTAIGNNISGLKIELNNNNNIELKLGETYEEYGANATYKKKDVSSEIKIDGNVDTNKVGEYTLTYTINENNKSKKVERTVKVIENIEPKIYLIGDETQEVLVNTEYKERGAKASDNYDGNISDKIKINGNVDTSKIGEYSVEYNVSDFSGNTAKKTRTVKVVDKTTQEEKENTLPVLMYHFFYDEAAGETGRDANFMEISSFDNQMKYLSENNFYFPTWDEVNDYLDDKTELPYKSIVVTADDGDESFFRLAVPVINKYDVKATSFIVTSWTGKATVDELKSNKLFFESHSHDMHEAGANGKGRFVNYTYDQAMNDVKTSAEITGANDAFCYPFGHYNDTAEQVLKDAGYKMAFTTKGGRIKPGQNKYERPRVRMSKGISMKSFSSMVD